MLHDSGATHVIGAIFSVEYDGVKYFAISDHLKLRSGQVRSKRSNFEHNILKEKTCSSSSVFPVKSSGVVYFAVRCLET